jgi:hypothetical protein
MIGPVGKKENLNGWMNHIYLVDTCPPEGHRITFVYGDELSPEFAIYFRQCEVFEKQIEPIDGLYLIYVAS